MIETCTPNYFAAQWPEVTKPCLQEETAGPEACGRRLWLHNDFGVSKSTQNMKTNMCKREIFLESYVCKSCVDSFQLK